MKTKLSLAALLLFSFTTIASAITHDQEVSVLETAPAMDAGVLVQDSVLVPEVYAPTPLQPALPPAYQPPMYSQDVFQDDVLMTAPRTVLSPVYAPEAACCSPCDCRTVESTVCLVDPCGCTHEACIRVPACCVGQTPQVSWRKGLLGRQIASVCWACCDHEVKVIVTRRGKVRVRG
ncbi:MAG: hypothetical protein AAF456_09140 [Planctomycetota bacterium]